MEEKHFEFCNNKRKINKILKEFEEGKTLNYDDDTELCFYRQGNFSMYLAVYDETLEWTFSEHFFVNNEEVDMDNVGSVLFTPHKPHVTTQDLKELCELLLPIAKGWYNEQGGYECLNEMSFLELENILNKGTNEMYKHYEQEKCSDIYSDSYDYDDMCIVIAIMDFVQQYDTELDTKLPDVEDVIALAKEIKKQWKQEFNTLSTEQQGYIGAYTHDYLKDIYL
ncbi:MAG: hypothetical protein J6J36_06630 [Clostridia bacterium]|nr:hypothetical protein [Clostridia bacterium]